VIALEISGHNECVPALQHRLDRPRAAIDRLLEQRGLSTAGPRLAPILAGMAEVHPKRWFSAMGFRLTME